MKLLPQLLAPDFILPSTADGTKEMLAYQAGIAKFEGAETACSRLAHKAR
jgi:hypothetical protein